MRYMPHRIDSAGAGAGSTFFMRILHRLRLWLFVCVSVCVLVCVFNLATKTIWAASGNICCCLRRSQRRCRCDKLNEITAIWLATAALRQLGPSRLKDAERGERGERQREGGRERKRERERGRARQLKISKETHRKWAIA